MQPDLDIDVPPPPEEVGELLAWAEAHEVAGRLDDLLIDFAGGAGTLPGRAGERFSYRDILCERSSRNPRLFRHAEMAATARRYLHRMATLVAVAQQREARLAREGTVPDDSDLAAFLERLRSELASLSERPESRRPVGTYERAGVKVIAQPTPLLLVEEWSLTGPRLGRPSESVGLALLGVGEGPLRWARCSGGVEQPGAVELPLQRSAIEAITEWLRDPACASEHEDLIPLLTLRPWQVALGALDETLARLDAESQAGKSGERVAFRVSATSDGGLSVDPVVQRRARGGAYSKGARVEWFTLPTRSDLSPADQRVFRAHDDRFARQGRHTGPMAPAQLWGVLRALIDHPAVFLDGLPESAGRLDIRHGRLKLGFATDPQGGLVPTLDLMGVALSPAEVAPSLRDDRHLVHLHRRPDRTAEVLLAELDPRATALLRALALSPARFPPEAHDALAVRLEALQGALDIEFPSRWTRSITPADGRPLVRLEVLGSGAVEIRLAVRPVAGGPIHPPGEGPTLLLEGQGRNRHGARRDRAAERQAAQTLVGKLALTAGEPKEPWCWRIGHGDPALTLVSALAELSRAGDIQVEWADENRLISHGGVGRGDLRMRVADRHEWFEIEGGAKVGADVVPLSMLLAAIRDGRRFVMVGGHGFARIEESLQQALTRAEGALVVNGDRVTMAGVTHDALMGLIEDESQLDASEAFHTIRRRMQEGAEELPRLPPALAAMLRPYQLAGVTWLVRLAHWGAGALLADEMGLGKTIQTLALLSHRASLGPALIVAPTSVVGNWVNEAARFVPELRLRLYRGPERVRALEALGPGDVVLTSYAIAAADVEELRRTRFSSLVLDEAQAVKNATTERSRALREVKADFRLGLTGTPIENHLGELWSLFRIVSPGLLGSWEQFRARFSIPIEKFGEDGRRRVLARLLRPFVLRRTKAEVARELPALTEVIRTVRLSDDERALYEELRLATLADLADAKKNPDRDASDMRMVMLAALTRMRQLCCHPRLVYPESQAGSSKAAHLMELCSELAESGRKVLVFSQFRSFLDLLVPRLRQRGITTLVLDGTTPAEAREQRVAAFSRGEADVFAISLKAGGFGLNLAIADTVIHLDPWWNPAVEDQATARAHRIGQTRPVTAVKLVAADTIEEGVLGLHAAKRALAAGILEGSDVAASLGTEDLIALIRSGHGPLPARAR